MVTDIPGHFDALSSLGSCALCMRQRFLDIESESPWLQEVRPAETIFHGTATCYMHLEDLYAETPITHNRKGH